MLGDSQASGAATRRRCGAVLALLLLAFAIPACSDQLWLVSEGVTRDTPLNGAGIWGLSADGGWLVLASSSPLGDPGRFDANGVADVYLWERATGVLTLVSHAAGSAYAGNGSSFAAGISSDGRYVAFYSSAADLIGGGADGNGDYDVFLWDRDTGTVRLVSHASAGDMVAGNGPSTSPTLSADGRYVAFSSSATDLIAGSIDANGTSDAFLWDRDTGVVRLVSHSSAGDTIAGNGASESARLSADGRYVTFYSFATDLIAGGIDANGTYDTFLWDRVGGGVVLVSHAGGSALVAGNGSAFPSTISADGRFVAFQSTSINLIAGGVDANGDADAFLWDRVSNTVTLVSHLAGSATTSANGGSYPWAISADGRTVAFSSSATDLIAGGVDGNGMPDSFLWDGTSGLVTLVSHASASATQAGDSYAYVSAMSADGRYVAFYSAAKDLIAGSTEANFGEDAFLWDRTTNVATLLSHSTAGATTTGNEETRTGDMSADGAYVALVSKATDLVAGVSDGNNAFDGFLWERATATLRLAGGVTAGGPTGGTLLGEPTAVSTGGRYVAFYSNTGDLIAGVTDTNGVDDAFLWDRETGTTTLVSHASGAPTTAANGRSLARALSADGRYLAFQSFATDLVAGGSDLGFDSDVFLWDRETGTTTLVSHASVATTTAGNNASFVAGISDDGRWVAFVSHATDLIAGGTDGNVGQDAFLWDRDTGVVTLVSHASAGPTIAGGATSADVAISGDGGHVVFSSAGADFVAGGTDTNGTSDAFRWERATGLVSLVSHSTAGTTVAANGYSFPTAISANGRYVAVQSFATDLVAGMSDANGEQDIYLWDGDTGGVTLVSHAAADPAATAEAGSYAGGMSDDGSVTFHSQATDLIAGGTDTVFSFDVFVWDRASGTVTLVSHVGGSATSAGSGRSLAVAISADGDEVLFESDARDLIPGGTDSNFSNDAFLWERASGDALLVSHARSDRTRAANGTSFPRVLSADGRFVALASSATDLMPGDFSPTWQQAFLWTPDSLGGDFHTTTPCRVVDTRVPGEGPALASGVPRKVGVHGKCGMPATARAVAVNLTVTEPTSGGFLTVFAGDGPMPPTSNLNFSAGQTRANNAIVTLAASDGSLTALAALADGATVELIVDLVGYFE